MKTSGDERPSWFQLKVKQPAALCYQRYFVELILRQKPLPPSKDGRHVLLNAANDAPLVDERRGHAYISNSIRSSRYTIFDFLPKQLLFQATRLSNFYFICIGVPQTIPGLSTTGSYTTILPLAFFILLTMAKEGYDDFCRHKLDKVENNLLALVLRRRNADGHVQASESALERAISKMQGLLWKAKAHSEEVVVEEKEPDEDDTYAWAKTKWHNVSVGDVIKLKRDDPVPADIILLHSTGENGVAYVETMGLDGETNLKPKQALPALLDACSTVGDIRRADVECVLEDPNPNLYDFNGKVTVNGTTLPLALNEVIYRGSVIRNTTHLYGLVVNTGEECKIRENANHHPTAKVPRLERYANQVVLTLIVYVVTLSVGFSMGYLLWHSDFEKGAWYLENAAPEFKQIIIGFLIMFNNIIPLALYISLEIVKVGQLLMVQSDVKMYDEKTDTTMRCNTNTILENLGQVSYILSDKTGTLTENVMRFRGISLGGVVWMHEPTAKAHATVEAEQSEKSTSTMPQQTKVEAMKPSFENPSIFVEEREIPSPSSDRSSEPRASKLYTRRSTSRPKQAPAERTTAELIEIMQRQPDSAIARKAREFILGLAICHTALPEVDSNGKIDFQASSPDELALVRAAQDLGYLLIQRSSRSVELLITNTNGSETKELYEILEVIEFSSKRKRMSIVVRCPNNRIWLICKGADSAIIPRLRQAELAERQSQEVRRSVDYGRRLARKSEQNESRNSFGARPSLQIRSRSSMDVQRSIGLGRANLDVPKPSYEIRRSLQQDLNNLEDKDDTALFARCFEHIDAFATEGLRTLLFAHKYLDADEYETWRKIHHEATTSLVHRQERIYAAGEVIEQGFDLLGASAIEDKLQKGVPETIEKLRKANIKIWMLTGDKRETAINIAHSARICQQTSVVTILDSTRGDLAGQMMDALQEESAHRVVVIDGQTLTIVSANPELKHTFFSTIISQIDSVIVCRASPAQKAAIVTAIRARLPGLTLAIGDGANDIAMIQAAHVGIGLSGNEGLQAARVADFSIAQFRFLQRLLLVHGRYQYVRTAKFVLLTFWKEMFFYMMQALYQRHNGFTGTSLYEAWSLTVLNTLFTSLCVIVPGIFEQDLRPSTLLAVPELYVFGQRNQGLNIPMYLAWMIHGGANGIIVWFVIWAAFGSTNVMSDRGLFALGDLAFTLGIVWTNWKCLILETQYKTLIVGISLVITVGGWFAWNGFMASVYSNNLSPYDVKGGFNGTFGTDWNWWLALLLALLILITLELVYDAVKRNLIAAKMWPRWRHFLPRLDKRKQQQQQEEIVVAEDMEIELWQQMERDPVIAEQLLEMAGEEGGIAEEEEEEEEEEVVLLQDIEIAEPERGRMRRMFWRKKG